MHPGSGESPASFEIPQSPEGELSEDTSLEQLPVKSPENRPQGQSIKASSAAAASMAAPSSAVTIITDDTAVSSNQTSAQTSAKDTDRIDKVWIDKAKAIISKTKDDPYEQKRELSRVKADYIKNRFNKTIKLDDTVAK